MNSDSDNKSIKKIIYVLTNPVMPGIVKIGKTGRSIEQRIRELDNTSVPVPYECMAAWEVKNPDVAEKALHRAFDKDRIRSTREFFWLSPDAPIAILEGFGIRDVTPTTDVVDEENPESDLVSLNRARSRRGHFKFSMVNIDPGETLKFKLDDSIECKVLNDREVEFRGKVMSLSASADLVLQAMGKEWKAVPGPDYWEYGGETLAYLRDN